MTNIEWIFLDLGWTLVDETRAHRARLKGVCERMAGIGLRHSVDELMRLCEQAATDFAPSPFRGMRARLELPEGRIRTLADSASYAHENEVLYPGVPEILEALSRQFKLGVIANQSEGTEKRLSDWGIRNQFSVVLASAELGLSKPDSRIFGAAVSRAGCDPERALMVGDRLDNDVGPAKLQGWKTMRVLQGFSRFQTPRRPEEIPDMTIPSILGLSDARQIGLPHLNPGAASRGSV
ncbi:MAG: HAD family hydrolase [Candidatus Latescibacteria bacterium]|nr:HAD family hydrolase [Candidatus Latescibacterota bacterium]